MKVEAQTTKQTGTRASTATPSLRASRVALVYLALGLTSILVFFMLPGSWRNVASDLIAASGVVAVDVGTRRNRPAEPLAWYAMAAGLSLLVAGDVIWTYYEEILHRGVPFPSVADVPYLAAYVPLAAGLALIVRARMPGRDLSSFIDAAIITVASAVASWIFLIAPLVGPDAPAMDRLVSVAYPMADLLLIAVMASLVFTSDVRAFAYRLIIGSLIAMITSDSVYTLASLHGWYESGSALDAGWLMSYVLWGGAALHPSMRKLSAPSTERERLRFTRRRLVVEAFALLVIPSMLVIQDLREDALHVPVVMGGAIVASVLVIVRMRALLRQLEDAAMHDPLTSLPNRRLLLDRLVQAFHRAERSSTPVAVLFLDLGGFKRVNDRFGHEAGDEALIEIGKRIVRSVRSSDTVARLGGDEFVIVCEGMTHALAETLAHRVRSEVAAPLYVDDQLIELSVDLGVAVEVAPEEGDVRKLLDAADRAMYRAKAAANDPGVR